MGWRLATRAVGSAAFALIVLGTTLKSNAADLIDSPALLLKYEVSLTSDTDVEESTMPGLVKVNRKLNRTFSAQTNLNIRSEGPSLSLTKLSNGSAGGTDASAAQRQAAMTELFARSESMANWMCGAEEMADDASDEESQAAMQRYINALMASATLEFTKIEVGDKLVNEGGHTYKMKTDTHAYGSARVLPAGQPMVELDAQAKHFILIIPYMFGDSSQTSMTVASTENIQFEGGAPSVTNTTQQNSLQNFPTSFEIDQSVAPNGSMPMIEGSFDPAAASITGEQSFKAKYGDGRSTLPATLTFRYTLTPP